MDHLGWRLADIASAALNQCFAPPPAWVDAQRADGPSGGDTAAPGRRERLLLIVDDEALVRAAVRRFFGRHGWRVLEADDGDEALAYLAEAGRHPPDLVIADRGMPRLDGVALHAALARSAPALARRFILASGDPLHDEVGDFVARTGCTVVGKPFALAALVAVAARVAEAADAAEDAPHAHA